MPQPYIIIGATGGVGSALARRLAARGESVHLIARDAGALAAELGASHANADILVGDQLEQAIAAAPTADGIKGLVYAVGSIVLKSLRQASADDFLTCFQLNTLGAARAVKAAQPGLKQAGGAVVLYSTIAVAQGFTNHSVISAAKGGIEGLTRALAAELAPHIRVNAIAPSLTTTKMAAPLTQNPQMADGIANLHAIPRLGQADEIAALSAFLLSADSGWISGQIIAQDGGRSRLRVKG